jgi:hypothetical protein
MALMSSATRRFSPWVLVIVAVAIVVLFAVGGGLVNAFYSCLVNLDTTTSSCNLAAYQAGLAFLSLGSLASLGWFVLLIIFLVSRPPRPQVVHYNMNPAPGNYAPAPNAQQAQAQAMPPQYYGGQPLQSYGAPMQYPAPVAPRKAAFVTAQSMQQTAPTPAPPYPVQELEAPVPPPSQQHSERRCGRCEAIVNSAFCSRCGSGVATS